MAAGSLGLRLGQAILSWACFLLICWHLDIIKSTSFRFTVVVMGLTAAWISVMVAVETYSVFSGDVQRTRAELLSIVMADGVLSVLALAAASSTAAVIDFLSSPNRPCHVESCARFGVSSAMAFGLWLLLAISFLLNFWALPKARA